MAVPYIFATLTNPIPLSELDTNFATPITLGTTALYLGNTVSTVDGLTLTNVSIASITGPTTITGSVTSPLFIATASCTSTATTGAFSYGTNSFSDVDVLASFQSSVNSYNTFEMEYELRARF